MNVLNDLWKRSFAPALAWAPSKLMKIDFNLEAERETFTVNSLEFFKNEANQKPGFLYCEFQEYCQYVR